MIKGKDAICRFSEATFFQEGKFLKKYSKSRTTSNEALGIGEGEADRWDQGLKVD